MAQTATFKWTNAATAAARFQSIGFAPAHVVIIGTSGVASRFEWNDQMPNGSYFNSGAGTYADADGITYESSPNAQFGQPLVGAGAAAFTNANPGVITVQDGSVFRAGDIINVTGIADDGSGTDTLNGQYTIASIAGNALTTTTNTTGYSVRVSGGNVTLYQRANGDGTYSDAVNTNVSSFGITIGTGAVGANSQNMVMTVWGKNNVT